MEFMTITLIDEARYDAEMDETVLPALRNCMAEGWMEPATVDWDGNMLPKLEHSGRLHYYCYDAHKFDALREDANTAKWCGTSYWPAIPYACSNIADMAIPRTT